jgi:hypothetical protein
VFDSFEVPSNGEIVFYWRGLDADKEKTVNLDMVKRYNGMCQGRESTAY